MAETLWADTDASWIEFGWVEGFHATGGQWVECGWVWVGWVEGDDVCLAPTSNWVECGWSEVGWVDGDGVCLIPAANLPARPIGGGGTGFERQSRISRPPQGTRSYKEKYRRDKRSLKQERDIIEFVVRFTTDYL